MMASFIYLHHFRVGELYKNSSGEWVIKFNGLSQTADSDVHVVHNIREHIYISLKKKSKVQIIPHRISIDSYH